MNQTLLTTIEWEVQIGFVASVLFPVVTRLYWPWNQSWWGWNTILLELSIAGVLFPSWLFINFHVENAGLQWLEAASLGAVTLNVLWRAVMIWRTQRSGAEADRESEGAQSS